MFETENPLRIEVEQELDRCQRFPTGVVKKRPDSASERDQQAADERGGRVSRAAKSRAEKSSFIPPRRFK